MSEFTKVIFALKGQKPKENYYNFAYAPSGLVNIFPCFHRALPCVIAEALTGLFC
jgi:hypothetical protein